MADLNSFNVVGRVVRDPEMRSGGAVTFTIANNGSKDSVNYLPVVCYDKTADNVAKYVRKGKQVAINGRVTQSSYEDKEGKKRSSIEVSAYQVQFLGSRDDATPTSRREKDVAIDDFDVDEPISLEDIPF